MALHPPILTNSQVFFFIFLFFFLLFFGQACLSQSSDSLFARAPPPTSCVRRIGLSSVMLCRAFHTPTHTPTHTHLTHTCRQAGSLLYLKALIPCHSPVLCCHALCGFAPKWPRPEPWGGGGGTQETQGTPGVCRVTAVTLTLPFFGISLTPPIIAC